MESAQHLVTRHSGPSPERATETTLKRRALIPAEIFARPSAHACFGPAYLSHLTRLEENL